MDATSRWLLRARQGREGGHSTLASCVFAGSIGSRPRCTPSARLRVTERWHVAHSRLIEYTGRTTDGIGERGREEGAERASTAAVAPFLSLTKPRNQCSSRGSQGGRGRDAAALLAGRGIGGDTLGPSISPYATASNNMFPPHFSLYRRAPVDSLGVASHCHPFLYGGGN